MPQAFSLLEAVFVFTDHLAVRSRQLFTWIGLILLTGNMSAQSSVLLTSENDPARLVQTINQAYDELAQYSLQHLQLAIHQPGTSATQASLGQLLSSLESADSRTRPLEAQSTAGERLLMAWRELLSGYELVFRRNLSGLAQPGQLDITSMEAYLQTYQLVTERLEQTTINFLAARQTYSAELGMQLQTDADKAEALRQLRQLNAYQLSIFLAVFRAEVINQQILQAFSRGDASAMQALRPQLRTALEQSQSILGRLPPHPVQDQYRQAGLTYLQFLAELNTAGYAALLRQLTNSEQAKVAEYNQTIQRLNEELPVKRRACRVAREALLRAFLPAPELLGSRI